MPPILVVEDGNGLLRINNGVTRPVRAYRLSPGTAVPVEVIQLRPRADFSRLKCIRDLP